MSASSMKHPRYLKVQMVLFGFLLAAISFGYGVYSLISGVCTVIGRGFPVGTFVTFDGIEARFLSSIYIGLGIYLFGNFYLRHTDVFEKSIVVSWAGVLLLSVGLCSLIFILAQPVISTWSP